MIDAPPLNGHSGDVAVPLITAAGIPDELKARPQWVLWRTVVRKGKGTKVPLTTGGRPAKSDDPSTWAMFDAVWTILQLQPSKFAGVGYVFAPDDPYCGVDLDLCMAPDGSFVTDWAEQALELLPSYAEISPSGRGIKIIARARFPLAEGDTGKTFRDLCSCGTMEGKQAEVAVWNDRRYFALTGRVYNGRTAIVACQAGAETLFRQYWSEDQRQPRKTNGSPAPENTTVVESRGKVNRQVLAAMRRATKGMSDGADGSKRLFCVACRAVEHDLSDSEAVATINAYAAKAPFPNMFSDSQILDRVRDAEKKVSRGAAVIIANFEEIEVEKSSDVAGGEGATEKQSVPKPLREIIEEILTLTGGFPRVVDSMLFVDDPVHGLGYFDRRTTAGLFGWLRGKATVKWAKGGAYVAQSELFAELERTATRYEAIEALPHEPSVEGVYYSGKTPAAGDGSHLRWLLNRFRPETTVDRDLIQAAFMTAFWGGAPGRRPAFVITSDDGRGVGKTTVAEMIGRLCGGLIDVSAGEDIETLKTRLLSPAARTIRAALLDNMKTLRLSWAELEALITSSIISGRQLFVGEGQRPNLLTWFITLNGVSMATDMAQRSVIIKVVKGKNDGPWHEETTRYIDTHRQEIIGDIIAALRGERLELASYSRWATWERDVLCRLPEPAEAQRVIRERQGEANCELDEAEIIEQYFADQLNSHGYDPATAQVRVPVATAAFWFSKAVGEPTKTAAASKRIHQMASEGQLKRLSPDKSRAHGRSFIWTGLDADRFSARIDNDLATRIADYLNRQKRDGRDGWDG